MTASLLDPSSLTVESFELAGVNVCGKTILLVLEDIIWWVAIR
jgi:hypothetical protein